MRRIQSSGQLPEVDYRSFTKKIYSASPTLAFQSVIKDSLSPLLISCLSGLPQGDVLDVGAKDSPYRRYVPQRRYVTLDICPSGGPDVCCDLHDIAIKRDSFDTIVAVEVLEHLYAPQQAVNEIRRILKSGGTFVATTRFICRYHPDPNDYYRFTSDGLRHLLSGFSRVDVMSHGNGLQALWHIINNDYRALRVLLNLFNPLFGRMNFPSQGFPLGFVVRATK